MDAFAADIAARDRGGPAQPLLSVSDLVKPFRRQLRRRRRLVRGRQGRDARHVGESGCGKSTWRALS